MDEERKQVEANLSADLVKHLQSQGMTLQQIGESRRVGTAHHYPSRWNKEWCAVHTLRGWRPSRTTRSPSPWPPCTKKPARSLPPAPRPSAPPKSDTEKPHES